MKSCAWRQMNSNTLSRHSPRSISVHADNYSPDTDAGRMNMSSKTELPRSRHKMAMTAGGRRLHHFTATESMKSSMLEVPHHARRGIEHLVDVVLSRISMLISFWLMYMLLSMLFLRQATTPSSFHFRQERCQITIISARKGYRAITCMVPCWYEVVLFASWLDTGVAFKAWCRLPRLIPRHGRLLMMRSSFRWCDKQMTSLSLFHGPFKGTGRHH